ncbi:MULTISPECIES: TonB-dependent receptor [Ramlibacter]|uniref:TonB-dependent receptor n=1 Tax=Ramlibacter aquaticus TaxID=2780094 RepID=A0ABR9SJE0_9BURK|nr:MULTISPECIES: TonB-dependent receptor [Ramlibacter]MBE7942447.1 TonB-dependent receptor [Ramlibacter aquaticus]
MQKSVLPRASALAVALSAIACAPAGAQSLVLPPTVVTATRFAEPVDALPLGVSVITGDEIRRSGATTVNEALMRILGLPGRQDFYGGGEYAIDLRGFGGTADLNQVVVVDGVRISESDTGGTRLAGIPIESVERIEVLRGSGAVLYGEGATGGVIVITTKAGAAGRPNGGSVYAAVGSHGLREGRANANVSAGEVSLDASVDKRDADNYRQNFRSRLEAGSLSAQWQHEGLRLGLRHAEDSLHAGLPGSLTADQFAADPSQTTTPDDRASIRNQRTSVNGDLKVAGWEIAGEAGTREKRLRSLNSGFAYDYNIHAEDAGLRARREDRIAGVGSSFTVGLDNSRWTRDVLGDFGTTAHQDNQAWYLKEDLGFASGTRLSAGWRSERIRKSESGSGSTLDGHPHAWDLGLSQQLAQGLTGYGRIGRSYRLASADEFSYTSPGVVLAPQVSRDTELGLRFARAGTRVDARLYRSMLTDEIGFDPNAAGPFGFAGANVNFDPTRRQGLEIDASQAYSAALALRANLNIRRATFREGPYAGKDVPLVPRASFALRAEWTPAASHHVGAGVQWVDAQHPDFDNACRIPAYAVADLRYAYDWKQAEFSVGVNNLFDRKYYTQAFGCASGTTSAIYPEAGRTVQAAVRLKF